MGVGDELVEVLPVAGVRHGDCVTVGHRQRPGGGQGVTAVAAGHSQDVGQGAVGGLFCCVVAVVSGAAAVVAVGPLQVGDDAAVVVEVVGDLDGQRGVFGSAGRFRRWWPSRGRGRGDGAQRSGGPARRCRAPRYAPRRRRRVGACSWSRSPVGCS